MKTTGKGPLVRVVAVEPLTGARVVWSAKSLGWENLPESLLRDISLEGLQTVEIVRNDKVLDSGK